MVAKVDVKSVDDFDTLDSIKLKKVVDFITHTYHVLPGEGSENVAQFVKRKFSKLIKYQKENPEKFFTYGLTGALSGATVIGLSGTGLGFVIGGPPGAGMGGLIGVVAGGVIGLCAGEKIITVTEDYKKFNPEIGIAVRAREVGDEDARKYTKEEARKKIQKKLAKCEELEDLVCYISLEIPLCGVTIGDGKRYDPKSILRWIAEKGGKEASSPIRKGTVKKEDLRLELIGTLKVFAEAQKILEEEKNPSLCEHYTKMLKKEMDGSFAIAKEDKERNSVLQKAGIITSKEQRKREQAINTFLDTLVEIVKAEEA